MSVAKAISDGRQLFSLIGNLLMVEKLPIEEIKTTSGLVIAGFKDQQNSVVASQPVFMRVVAVGEGTINDIGDELPCDTAVGAIILVGDMSVRWLSHLPIKGYSANSVGITNESEIQLRFESEEKFQEWKRQVSQ